MKKRKMLLAAVVFAVGLAFACFGVYTGENNAIRAKGAVVCLECIGIDG